MSLDVFTLGEALLRLSVPPGIRVEAAGRFDVHTAGAEANVAVALARLGRSVSWWSKLPDGPLGRRVLTDLRGAGVNVDDVGFEPGTRLGTYYVELNAPPRPVTVTYDRRGSAATTMTAEEVPTERVDEASWVLLSGITPALSASCESTVTAVADRARSGGARLAVDVNYRAKLWPADRARTCLEGVAAEADLLVCTREDARDVFGLTGSPDGVLRALADLIGAQRVVVTLGEEGAAALDTDGIHRVPAVPASVVDRLGAGDAFTAGVLDGLLDGSLPLGLERGVALASMVLGTSGDHFHGSRAELEALRAGEGRSVDR